LRISGGIEFRRQDSTRRSAYVESRNEIGITIHSGKNRVVRRIFEQLGYNVEKLDRVSYAGLTKKDLPRGHWRFLKQEEINILKMST
jgi:23S rRNA pseudouridine2605 synthase